MNLIEAIEREKWVKGRCGWTETGWHNASLDRIAEAAKQTISERDELLEEVKDLVNNYGLKFNDREAEYYDNLLKKYNKKDGE